MIALKNNGHRRVELVPVDSGHPVLYKVCSTCRASNWQPAGELESTINDLLYPAALRDYFGRFSLSHNGHYILLCLVCVSM